MPSSVLVHILGSVQNKETIKLVIPLVLSSVGFMNSQNSVTQVLLIVLKLFSVIDQATLY